MKEECSIDLWRINRALSGIWLKWNSCKRMYTRSVSRSFSSDYASKRDRSRFLGRLCLAAGGSRFVFRSIISISFLSFLFFFFLFLFLAPPRAATAPFARSPDEGCVYQRLELVRQSAWTLYTGCDIQATRRLIILSPTSFRQGLPTHNLTYSQVWQGHRHGSKIT